MISLVRCIKIAEIAAPFKIASIISSTITLLLDLALRIGGVVAIIVRDRALHDKCLVSKKFTDVFILLMNEIWIQTVWGFAQTNVSKIRTEVGRRRYHIKNSLDAIIYDHTNHSNSSSSLRH